MRVAPEVAVLEFLVQVFKAELYGETYLSRIPHKITIGRVRVYDASGRLLRDAEI
ncbi:hypothetical protein AB0E59_14470 [Lentzea sp. NPDC034063]|uniref:hypothetical protein n=1 Tax=unclassified Lentzea TaxID=2643253 RepID=UPI0033C1F768